MAPPQWAYDVENFVNKPDDELVCSVCHSIFSDPVICPCDHVFCRVCITKWLQNNSNCPICRKEVPMYSIKQMVPIIKNLIMKLILYCQNKEHGCEAQFTLEKSEAHIKECNYELVQCKNKPCKKKVFRKDIQDHETNGCSHRYIKCKKCGSKISFSSLPKNHDCIRALQISLRRKNTLIRKKNNMIKELRNEIKALKETHYSSAESLTSPSTVFSFSPDEIMINTDLESLTSGISDTDDSFENHIIAIFDDLPSYSSDENGESESFSIYMNNQGREDSHNEALSDYVIDVSNENQNDSYRRNESPLEHDSITVEAPDFVEQRRPTKQGHFTPLYSTSDDEDNEAKEHNTLPYPTQNCCWHQASDNTSAAPPENNLGISAVTYMEPGPSSKYTVNTGSTHNASFNSKEYFHTKTFDQKDAKDNTVKRSTFDSKSVLCGNATFERTFSQLEEYNFDSDLECLPEVGPIEYSSVAAFIQDSSAALYCGTECRPNCKVYVGELGTSGNKHEIQQIFSYFGPLRNVWVARNPPGFAFVEFEEWTDARNAVRDLDGSVVCGQRVRVELASKNSQKCSRGYPFYSPRPFHSGVRCYHCGERGHYARNCKRTRV